MKFLFFLPLVFVVVIEHDKKTIDSLKVQATLRRFRNREQIDPDDGLKAWHADRDVRKSIKPSSYHNSRRDAFAMLSFGFHTRNDTSSKAIISLCDETKDVGAIKKMLVGFSKELKLQAKGIDNLAIAAPFESPKILGERATRIWNCYCDYENGELIDDPYLFNKRINDLSDVAAQIVRGAQNAKLSSSSSNPITPVFPSSMNAPKRPKLPCCFNWNLPETTCSFGNLCNYGHNCFACGSNHPLYSCRQANAPQLLGEVRKKLQKILDYAQLLSKFQSLAQDSKYYSPFGFVYNVDNWNFYLSQYPNKEIAERIRSGLNFGFTAHYRHSFPPPDSLRNPPMNVEQKIAMLTSLLKEIRAGKTRFVRSSEKVVLNPLNTGPKKDGSFRPILNLSHPDEFSVNSETPREFKTCSLISFEQVAEWILGLGKGCFIAALDLKSAWRQFPIDLNAQRLMGSCWEGLTLTDTALPFGWCESVRIFTEIDAVIAFVLDCRLPMDLRVQISRWWLIAYIDDFSFGAPSSVLCARLLQFVIQTFDFLGLVIKWEKLQAPSQSVKILGYLYDSRDLTVALPAEKVSEYSKFIAWILKRRSVKRVIFESLLGKLNDAAKIVWPGRALLKFAYTLLPPIRIAYHHIPLTRRVKADFRIFDSYLHTIKKVPLVHVTRTISKFDCTVYSDASKSGLGIVLPPYWASFELPNHLRCLDIDLLEALALSSAAKSFQQFIQGKCVLFGYYLFVVFLSLCTKSAWVVFPNNLPVFVDNKTVEGAFAKKMAKKWETQSLIRNLLLWAATTRTYFYVKLSRLELVRFWTNVSLSLLRMNPAPLDFQLWLWNECDKF